MLFLAVTAGYFVENQREHYLEHQREKQFIQSFCEDLKSDTGLLKRLISFRQRTIIGIDSLIYYLKMPDPDTYGKFIYHYARPIVNNPNFYSNDRTIQQLKNAGNLRLIRDQEASDNIMLYDWEVRRSQRVSEREETFLLDYIELLKQLFDGDEFDKMMIGRSSQPYIGWSWPQDNPHLQHKDKENIQRLINNLHFIKAINTYNINWNNGMIDRASKLLALLKKDYHLEK